jgi:signal transduction histidine kinase
LGLRGIAESLRGVGGELRLHSRPGAGTTVDLVAALPVPTKVTPD